MFLHSVFIYCMISNQVNPSYRNAIGNIVIAIRMSSNNQSRMIALVNQSGYHQFKNDCIRFITVSFNVRY